MPRHDWVPVVVIGGMIAFGGLIAVLVSDWTASRGVFEYHNPKYDKARTADAYCQPVTPAAPAGVDASKDRRFANGEDPEQKEYDLCQQWRQAKAAENAATYAGWQALAAILSTVLLLVATGAAIFAALYAKRAADAGRGAVNEAKNTTNAAERTIQATKDIGHAQLRPYVHAIHVNIHRNYEPNTKKLSGVEVTVQWRNSGQTPAKRLCGTVSFKSFESSEPPDNFNFPDAERRALQECAIGVGQDFNTSLLITPEEISRAIDTPLNIYYWGWVEYADNIDRRVAYRTETCPHLFVFKDPTGGDEPQFRVTMYHKFNGADEDCFRKPKYRVATLPI